MKKNYLGSTLTFYICQGPTWRKRIRRRGSYNAKRWFWGPLHLSTSLIQSFGLPMNGIKHIWAKNMCFEFLVWPIWYHLSRILWPLLQPANRRGCFGLIFDEHSFCPSLYTVYAKNTLWMLSSFINRRYHNYFWSVSKSFHVFNCSTLNNWGHIFRFSLSSIALKEYPVSSDHTHSRVVVGYGWCSV